MLCFLSAKRAWVSCWHLGMDHNTERGKVVKCSKHTNNTYFVVSTARGLKNITEVLLLKLWLLFVWRENVCLGLVWQSQPFGWMSSLTDEPFLDKTQCEKEKESKKRMTQKEKRKRKRGTHGARLNEMGRRLTEACASKWEMKTQRGSVGVWGLEQGGLTKAIIIYSGMS